MARTGIAPFRVVLPAIPQKKADPRHRTPGETLLRAGNGVKPLADVFHGTALRRKNGLFLFRRILHEVVILRLLVLRQVAVVRLRLRIDRFRLVERLRCLRAEPLQPPARLVPSLCS